MYILSTLKKHLSFFFLLMLITMQPRLDTQTCNLARVAHTRSVRLALLRPRFLFQGGKQAAETEIYIEK